MARGPAPGGGAACRVRLPSATTRQTDQQKGMTMGFKMVSVHTKDGRWVGSFYSEAVAQEWIDSRMTPDFFTIDPKRKADSEPVRGTFIQSNAKKALRKKADEHGFIPDPPFEGKHAAPAGGKHKAGTAPTPRTRTTSDDEVLAAAVAESLATDKTDDNTREHEELAL